MSPRFKLIGLVGLEMLGVALLASLLVLVIQALPPALSAPTPAGPPAAASPAPLATVAAAATPTAAPVAALTLVPAASPSPWLPMPTPGLSAQVAATATGLRLRATPGTAGQILRELDAGEALSLLGRSDNSEWLEVTTALGEHGWVSAAFVEVAGEVGALAITGTAVEAPVAGHVSGVSAQAREIFLRGQALGNRDFAFSMVGDSNTDNPAFLAPFDTGAYNLGEYADLELTVGYFKGSFSRDSAAAQGGFSTARVLDPAYADGRCNAGETPLACEYRLNQPSVALILLGTGDQHAWQGFEARYRRIIEYSIGQGVIPVLITKADDLESIDNTAPPGFINAVIRRLAIEYDVPLIDLRRAVEPLPNRGCQPDGFHFNTPPDGQSAVFDDEHLRYGYPVRNLTALQALDALRQYVLYSPSGDG